ncbi:MAG: monoamine oxidase, partial [Verrucomicrobiales bacterium]
RDWSVDPFGGAFYTWNVVANGAEVESKMLQIDDDVPLHIVGSAYSTDQGWAEGALATAERLVTEKLSIAPPSWLR